MSEIVKFGDLYALPSRNGLTRPSAVRGSGYRMAAMGEIFASDYVGDSEMDRVQLNERELSVMMLQEDDLLFARQSLVLSGAGKCAIVRGLAEPTTFESHLIRVRLNAAKANPLFYMYYFLSPLSPMKSIVQQGVQAGIRGSDLTELRVHYFPKETQDKISAILSNYDSAITNCRKQIALLEEAAMRLYREWFADGKGKEELLWNVCHYTRGVSYTSKEIESPNGMPLITLKNIERFGGFREDRSKTYSGVCRSDSRVGANGVLMAVTDMTKERRLVGHVAMVPDSYTEAAFSMDLIHLTGQSIPDLYLYAMLRYSGIAENLASHASGANVIHLKPSSLDSVKVTVPEKGKIDRYLKLFEPMIKQKNGLLNQIRSLTEARDRLLPKLMKGEIAV